MDDYRVRRLEPDERLDKWSATPDTLLMEFTVAAGVIAVVIAGAVALWAIGL